MSVRRLAMVAIIGALLVAPAGRSAVAAPALVTYRVTFLNLTGGQPYSPPVAATHHKDLHVFEVGKLASDEVAAIAVGGDQIALFNRLRGARGVTDVIDIGRPITPRGIAREAFTDSATFDIRARPGDRLSFVTMLICTNDGFTGLDAVELPNRGAVAYLVNAYDAGRENNTEQSQDLVDPCILDRAAHVAAGSGRSRWTAIPTATTTPRLRRTRGNGSSITPALRASVTSATCMSGSVRSPSSSS